MIQVALKCQNLFNIEILIELNFALKFPLGTFVYCLYIIYYLVCLWYMENDKQKIQPEINMISALSQPYFWSRYWLWYWFANPTWIHRCFQPVNQHWFTGDVLPGLSVLGLMFVYWFFNLRCVSWLDKKNTSLVLYKCNGNLIHRHLKDIMLE